MISYNISPLSGNRFRVQVTLEQNSHILDFYLPVWIPGSYMRRDFSRHLNLLSIHNNNNPIDWKMLSPSHWQAHGDIGQWQIEYDVYARDYSVRGCYLDDVRGIFNPCCGCVAIRGGENCTHQLLWRPDESRQNWEIAGAGTNAPESVFLDYQTLIDTPLMMGEKFTRSNFEAGGVTHEIIISGEPEKPYAHDFLSQNVSQICREEIKFFTALPAQVKHYTFLLFLTNNTFGGLEHQTNTLLMAPRQGLPYHQTLSTPYIQLLSLFSHEYFHTWNVKNMRPTEYCDGYQLEQEQPSEMLWLFEGFTAYFDNLILVRSGVISEQEYLKLLGMDISHHLQRYGHQHQTLAHSSFEAWTKLYNGGENGSNISTNYYGHGALAAWCLDAFIRVHSHDNHSLGSLMPILWKNENIIKQGLDEKQFKQIVKQHLPSNTHDDFDDYLYKLIHRCNFLPLDWAAQQMGIDLSLLTPVSADDTGTIAPVEKRATSEAGFRWIERNGRFYLRINNPNSNAMLAGLSADDEILTVNGERVGAETLWRALCCSHPETTAHVTISRDGLSHDYEWILSPPLKNTCLLTCNKNAPRKTKARRKQWLNQALEDSA